MPDLVADYEPVTRARAIVKADNLRWPVRAAYLRALTDLGLPDVKIAAYFKVNTQQVRGLRNLYRIAEGKWRA